MGSSCSILNDTEYEVWVTDRINWPVLIGVSAGVAALLISAGVIAIFLVLGPKGGGKRILEMARMVGGAATPIIANMKNSKKIVTATADAFQLPLGREVLNSVSIERLGRALNITEKQAEDLQKFVREFQAEAKLIRPGEKYTWSGTLSLNRRIHVMNEKLQFADKACFTGPTDGSENVYRISEHFTRLDVRKR